MKTITINNLKEMEKYYDEKINTYVFNGNVEFTFNLYINSSIIANDIYAYNIKAYDIYAYNIKARDINAYDIDARTIAAHDIDARTIAAHDIKANDILYYAVCYAYINIKCKSIKGVRKNCKHFVLDGVLEVLENDK